MFGRQKIFMRQLASHGATITFTRGPTPAERQANPDAGHVTLPAQRVLIGPRRPDTTRSRNSMGFQEQKGDYVLLAPENLPLEEGWTFAYGPALEQGYHNMIIDKIVHLPDSGLRMAMIVEST